jgi:hypothetical protein
MRHQSTADNYFHSLVNYAKCITKSLPIQATLAFALLLGAGQATATNATSNNRQVTVTATASKTAKVRKVKKAVVHVKPIPVKPAPPTPVPITTKPQDNRTSPVVFGQEEVDQNKFIAIAQPYNGGNFYHLLVLEQISPKRACWSESENSGVAVVNPLLLNFDFTGICGRGTDSNGYSIRMAGQDLGMQYDLDIVRRGDQLVLIGTNFRDRTAQTIEIGKTSGISDGFLKFNLEPGWRFSKRTYDGKVLGHVYLSNDNLALRSN